MLAIFTRKYQKTFFVSETAIFVEIEIENTVLGPVSKKYIRGKIILLSVTSNKKPYRHLLYQEEIPLLDVIRITVSCFKCYVILGSVSSFLCDYLNDLCMPALDVLFW